MCDSEKQSLINKYTSIIDGLKEVVLEKGDEIKQIKARLESEKARPWLNKLIFGKNG